MLGSGIYFLLKEIEDSQPNGYPLQNGELIDIEYNSDIMIAIEKALNVRNWEDHGWTYA